MTAMRSCASGQNFFHNRNITAIVLEVPNDLIGTVTVHAWSTGVT